jgi:hypothetical protein
MMMQHTDTEHRREHKIPDPQMREPTVMCRCRWQSADTSA